jgi:DNA-binding helix-hairpin-helix protein with protein kinase domain
VRLTDGTGKSLTLGNKLGSGGEGAVYEIQGSVYVAKIYNRSIDSEKTAKLRAIVQGCSPDLLEIAAWPRDVVHQDGRVCELLMPRVTGWDVHQLYSPAQRKIVFPQADWAFLVHTARNVAGAVHDIHKHGHVIGDVNQGNFKVSDKATVKLIDCDSFQIRSNGRVYICEVGVPDFTPPELQGVKSFATAVRTANHDNFGLAVLLFHLLFMGRHPFVGRFLGHGDMPIEKAIREFRFAFGPDAAAKKMTPPPFALPLEAASSQVAGLFVHAFSAKSTQGGRPTAKEWLQALDNLRRSLRHCREGHTYPSIVRTCPWCEFENQGQFFFLSLQRGPTSAFDAQRVRIAINSFRLSEVSISYSIPPIRRPPAPLPAYQRSFRFGVDAAGVSLIGSVIAIGAGVSPLFALVCAALWLVLVTITPYGRNLWCLRLKGRSVLKEVRQRQ